MVEITSGVLFVFGCLLFGLLVDVELGVVLLRLLLLLGFDRRCIFIHGFQL